MRKIILEDKVCKEIVNRINAGELLKDVAKEYGRHPLVLRKILKRSGYSYKNISARKELSETDIKKALDIYRKGTSLKETAKIFCMTDSCLNRNFKENGIDIKKLDNYGKHKDFNLIKNIFKTIDTEEKAYWLGFLLADGYISKNKQYLELGLQERDLNHIKKFLSFLNSSSKIKYKPSTKSYKVTVTSKIICNDLIRHGVYNNKSLTCTLNEEILSDENLKWHYLRGFYDGDGSISAVGETGLRMSFVSNKYLTTQIKQELYKYFEKRKIYKKQGTEAYSISCYGKSSKELLTKLYKDSNIYLDRKYEKFIAVLGRKLGKSTR